MDIIEKRLNEIIIFKLNGNLNSNTSPELENKIFEAIKNDSKNMILDFEDLDYISGFKNTFELKMDGDLSLICFHGSPQAAPSNF